MSDFNLRLGLMPYVPTPFPIQFIIESGTDGYGINAVGSKIEWFMQVERAGNLNAMGFLFGGMSFMSGQTTTPTMRISLQGIDAATGQPDGVIKTSKNFRPMFEPLDPPGTDWAGKWQWIDVPPATVTRGEFVAIVIEYISGPIGPPQAAIRGRVLSSATAQGGFPYTAFNPLGTRFVDSSQPIVGYKVDGAAYGWPIQRHDFTTFSGGAMQALRFVLDPGWVNTFRLAGCTWQGEHTTTTGVTYSMRLYEGTVEIGRTTVDVDHSASSKRSNNHVVLFDEGALPELVSGTVYRLAIVADNTQSAIRMDVFKTSSNLEMGAFPGGVDWYMSKRDSASVAWTDESASRPFIDLIISDWGVPISLELGVHVKVTPRFNDPMFVQHADDQIESNVITIPSGTDAHEFPGFPIGDAIESYSGYATIEVFLDPDVARSIEFLIHPECPIEQLKFIRWSFTAATFELVFRLRATEGSAVFREVIRFVEVIIPPP